MADKAELKGHGGWLLLIDLWLFIVALRSITAGPLLLIASIFATKDDLFFLSPITGIFATAAGVLAIYSLYLAKKKRKKFALYAIITQWLAFVAGTTSLFIAKIPESMNIPLIIIISVAFSGIWTAYLLKSRRVKNTFVE